MSSGGERNRCPLTFSFAAAGWLQTYHFGVAKAIQEVGLATDATYFCGSSAGSLAAAGLVCKVDFDELLDYAVSCVTDCHSSWLNAFRIREYVHVGIERFAVSKFRENHDLKEKLDEQLEVYISVLPWCRKKIISKFDSHGDLEEALIASTNLVPLAGLPFKLRRTGEYVCDGGLTAFQPRKGEKHVITVSAMYFNSADIRPSSFLPAWYGLYPPDEKTYRDIFDEGFNDAINFLVREKYIESAHLLRLKKVPKPVERTNSDVVLDIVTGVAFMLLLRPWALLFIYAEMLVATIIYVGIAVIHATKSGKWANVYHSMRNLVSARVLLHTLLGSTMPANVPRLEKHSRLYRILKPFLYV